MFKVDDLSDKVSKMKLGDIINYVSDDDYYIPDDYDVEEFKIPIRVRLAEEVVRTARKIMEKYDCSSNVLYKSATKLGAMIMKENEDIKLLEDISWFYDTVYFKAQEDGNDYIIDIMYEYMEKIASTSNMFCFGRGIVAKSIYPYPKWRLILNKFSYTMSTTISNVYRIAIIYAFSTEYKLKSLDELVRSIQNVGAIRLGSVSSICKLI